MPLLPLHASAPTRAHLQADRYKAIAAFRRETHKRPVLRLRYRDLSGHILALSLLLMSMFPSMLDQPLLSGSARRVGGRLYDLEYDDRMVRAFVEGVPDGMARRNEGGVKASLLVQHLARLRGDKNLADDVEFLRVAVARLRELGGGDWVDERWRVAVLCGLEGRIAMVEHRRKKRRSVEEEEEVIERKQDAAVLITSEMS